MKKIILLLIFILMIIPVSGYEMDYYQSDSGANTDMRHAFFMQDYTDCNITAYSYYDNSTNPVTARFYQPYSDFRFYSAGSSGSANCHYGGKYEWSGGDDEFELKITQDYVAGGHVWYHVECPEKRDYIYINASGVDSDGYLQNAFCADSNLNMTYSNFERCDSDFLRCVKSGLPNPYRSFAIPFIAGYNNTQIYLNYEADFGNANEDFYVYVYNFSDSADIAYSYISMNTAINNFIVNQSLSNLEPLQKYVFMFTFNKGTGVYSRTMNQFFIKTFDYAPEINCTEWSECDIITDTQSRFCSDALGMIESYYEYQACYSAAAIPDEYAYFGFRNLTSIKVPVCVPQWNIAWCENIVVNKTIYVPDGWDIIDSYELGEKTAGMQPYRGYAWSDMSGFNFKMWNKPPKPNEAVFNHSGTNLWECINSTDYTPTWIRKNISDSSVQAEFNITFPSSNMLMWFTVKKCAAQAYQYKHEDSAGWFGVSCGELCYSGSCDDDVKGGFEFYLWDFDSGEKILYFSDSALSELRDYSFDISNLNITANKTYRITLGTYEADYTTDGTCLEFRDFGYGISDNAFSCVSYCDPDTYHYMKANYLDDVCFWIDNGYDSNCIDTQYEQYYLDCISFCDENNDYHEGNNITGQCLWTISENSELCTEPATSIHKSVIPTEYQNKLTESGFGIVNDFTSITGLIILGIIAVLIYTGQKKNPDGSSGGVNIVAVLIAVSILVFFLVSLGYLSWFYLAVMIIVLGFLFSRTMVDIFTSGGG